jgi:Raf kinase inhibitor-like YbhB/YbcL family protein
MSTTDRKHASPGTDANDARSAPKARLEVTSPAFRHGEAIPKRYASEPEGQNARPDFRWSPAPSGTAELVVVVDDPDAPRERPWVHWVAWGIDPSATGVMGSSKDLVEGRNDFGKDGWGGPLPPKGDRPHRYHVRVYAVGRPIGLEPGATKDDVLKAMLGHVLADGELVGTYQR